MIDRDHALSVTRQAEAVGIARSTVYYLPRPVSAEDVALMKQFDVLHMEFPFAGARMLRLLLAAKGTHCLIENVTGELVAVTGLAPLDRVCGGHGGNDQLGGTT